MIILALGTNLGDRRQNLQNAYAAIAAIATITARASIYETGPRYMLDQPHFLNTAVAVHCGLSPVDLLRSLKNIEQQLGRQAAMRNGPRLIDIDIIYYNDIILTTPQLILPHPRRAERRFVLQPLCDLAPTFRDPETQQTVAAMLAKTNDADDVRLYDQQWP